MTQDGTDRLVEEFTVQNSTFPNTLTDDLEINPALLVDEFATHAERFAWYATAYELALSFEGQLKEELSRTYARLDYSTRADAKNAGVKLTEKMVENTVITHANYVELHENYLEAKKHAGLLKAARDAMIHKRDMLIQMGATCRAEGASDISLREQHYLDNKR